jgi:hypothetical protein
MVVPLSSRTLTATVILASVLLALPTFPLPVSGLNPTRCPASCSSSTSTRGLSRRHFFAASSSLVVGGLLPPTAAAETVGKDEGCNDATCLGIWDGLLADCPHPANNFMGGGGSAACVSSQDDTPGVFAEPWDFAESDTMEWEEQMQRLVVALVKVSARRGDDLRFLVRQGRYVRVAIVDAQSQESSVGEFYLTPNDTTVQFRIGSLAGTHKSFSPFSNSLSNLERSEELRKELRYLKVPVLRNRRRSLFFVEADGLDSFGPGSAALGPPAEMTTGELEGRQDVDPRLKIDLLQQFPLRR